MIKFDPKGYTALDLYGPAMKVTTQEEADLYLEELVNYQMKRWNLSDKKEVKRTLLSNIGYWSGYYDDETAERVKKLFKTVHPIFGS